MEKIRYYIKTNNSFECYKARKILNQLGYSNGNFISSHCEGWVYGDDDGIIKFLRQDVTSYPAAHCGLNKEYQVFDIDYFPVEIIKEYKLNNIKKLVSKPIVTKKEYKNTIEILKECREHIIRNESDYVMGKYFTNVIKKIETYLDD